MYSDVFCKVYNEFGWNYYPEIFGEHLLQWLNAHGIAPKTAMDLACGTGILCQILHKEGIAASGMDFSSGMIDIARSSSPEIHYDVADMITYCPEKQFDLVTCTGDAINHIMELSDVAKIFQNVYDYLAEDGCFIFDILSEKEVPMAEPIDLDFSEEVKALFMVTTDQDGYINLKTTVYESDGQQFEENIRETVHDEKEICKLLTNVGFQLIKCDHHLLENEGNHSATWYIIAKK